MITNRKYGTICSHTSCSSAILQVVGRKYSTSIGHMTHGNQQETLGLHCLRYVYNVKYAPDVCNVLVISPPSLVIPSLDIAQMKRNLPKYDAAGVCSADAILC